MAGMPHHRGALGLLSAASAGAGGTLFWAYDQVWGSRRELKDTKWMGFDFTPMPEVDTFEAPTDAVTTSPADYGGGNILTAVDEINMSETADHSVPHVDSPLATVGEIPVVADPTTMTLLSFLETPMQQMLAALAFFFFVACIAGLFWLVYPRMRAIYARAKISAMRFWQRLPAPVRRFAENFYYWYANGLVSITAHQLSIWLLDGNYQQRIHIGLAILLALLFSLPKKDIRPPHKPIKPPPSASNQGGGTNGDPPPADDGSGRAGGDTPGSPPDGSPDAPSNNDPPTCSGAGQSRSTTEDDDAGEEWFHAPEDTPSDDSDSDADEMTEDILDSASDHGKPYIFSSPRGTLMADMGTQTLDKEVEKIAQTPRRQAATDTGGQTDGVDSGDSVRKLERTITSMRKHFDTAMKDLNDAHNRVKDSLNDALTNTKDTLNDFKSSKNERIDELEDRIKSLKARIQELSKDLNETKRNERESKAEAERYKERYFGVSRRPGEDDSGIFKVMAENEELKRMISSLEQAVKDAQDEADRQRSRADLLAQEKAGIERNAKGIHNKNKALEDQIKTLTEQLSASHSRSRGLEEQLVDSEQRNSRLEMDVSRMKIERGITRPVFDDQEKIVAELKKRETQLRNDLAVSNASKESLQRQVDASRQQGENKASVIQKLRESNEQLVRAESNANSTKTVAETALTNLEKKKEVDAELSKASTSNKDKQEEMEDLRKKLEIAEGKVSALKKPSSADRGTQTGAPAAPRDTPSEKEQKKPAPSNKPPQPPKPPSLAVPKSKPELQPNPAAKPVLTKPSNDDASTQRVVPPVTGARDPESKQKGPADTGRPSTAPTFLGQIAPSSVPTSSLVKPSSGSLLRRGPSIVLRAPRKPNNLPLRSNNGTRWGPMGAPGSRAGDLNSNNTGSSALEGFDKRFESMNFADGLQPPISDAPVPDAIASPPKLSGAASGGTNAPQTTTGKDVDMAGMGSNQPMLPPRLPPVSTAPSSRQQTGNGSAQQSNVSLQQQIQDLESERARLIGLRDPKVKEIDEYEASSNNSRSGAERGIYQSFIRDVEDGPDGLNAILAQIESIEKQLDDLKKRLAALHNGGGSGRGGYPDDNDNDRSDDGAAHGGNNNGGGDKMDTSNGGNSNPSDENEQTDRSGCPAPSGNANSAVPDVMDTDGASPSHNPSWGSGFGGFIPASPLNTKENGQSKPVARPPRLALPSPNLPGLFLNRPAPTPTPSIPDAGNIDPALTRSSPSKAGRKIAQPRRKDKPTSTASDQSINWSELNTKLEELRTYRKDLQMYKKKKQYLKTSLKQTANPSTIASLNSQLQLAQTSTQQALDNTEGSKWELRRLGWKDDGVVDADITDEDDAADSKREKPDPFAGSTTYKKDDGDDDDESGNGKGNGGSGGAGHNPSRDADGDDSMGNDEGYGFGDDRRDSTQPPSNSAPAPSDTDRGIDGATETPSTSFSPAQPIGLIGQPPRADAPQPPTAGTIFALKSISERLAAAKQRVKEIDTAVEGLNGRISIIDTQLNRPQSSQTAVETLTKAKTNAETDRRKLYEELDEKNSEVERLENEKRIEDLSRVQRDLAGSTADPQDTSARDDSVPQFAPEPAETDAQKLNRLRAEHKRLTADLEALQQIQDSLADQKFELQNEGKTAAAEAVRKTMEDNAPRLGALKSDIQELEEDIKDVKVALGYVEQPMDDADAEGSVVDDEGVDMDAEDSDDDISFEDVDLDRADPSANAPDPNADITDVNISVRVETNAEKLARLTGEHTDLNDQYQAVLRKIRSLQEEMKEYDDSGNTQAAMEVDIDLVEPELESCRLDAELKRVSAEIQAVQEAMEPVDEQEDDDPMGDLNRLADIAKRPIKPLRARRPRPAPPAGSNPFANFPPTTPAAPATLNFGVLPETDAAKLKRLQAEVATREKPSESMDANLRVLRGALKALRDSGKAEDDPELVAKDAERQQKQREYDAWEDKTGELNEEILDLEEKVAEDEAAQARVHGM